MVEAITQLNPSSGRRLDAVTQMLIAWCAGLVVGSMLPSGHLWMTICIILATLVLGVAMWLRRRQSRGLHRICVGAAVVLAAATWWLLRVETPPVHDIHYLIRDESRLVDLTGTIINEPRVRFKTNQGLGQFLWSPPTTRFVLRMEQLHLAERDETLSGALLVAVRSVDVRWRTGDRVRVRGWLAAIPPPSNPGELDFRQQMHRMGIAGHLFAQDGGNITTVMADQPRWPFRRWRQQLSDHVADVLRLGISVGSPRSAEADEGVALLEAMLLGRRSHGLDEVYESFRQTGLAHVLAISGLHVGLLAVGVWFVVRVLTGRPRWGAMLALSAVLLYLLIVPWRVPILRAGFMTVVCCLGLSFHRRPSAMMVMSLIGWALLIWRPADIFNAGFQLSFAIVAALLLFTESLSNRIMPLPPTEDYHPPTTMVSRSLVNYLAVSIVAWLTAMPIVAFHFQMMTPLAVTFSVLAMPIVVVVLWLGLAKIMIGLIHPSLGATMADPLMAITSWWIAGVRWAADLPGAWLEVPHPSPAWAITTFIVVIALLGGCFVGRRGAMVVVLVICAGWLYGPVVGKRVLPQPPLTIHMIDVGDGSCFVIQSAGRSLMFDCGSANYSQIGAHTIVPTLRALGVQRLDAIVISHADIDHYNGILDVIDYLPVDRVILTRTTTDIAEQQIGIDADGQRVAHRATGKLWLGLQERRIPIQWVEAGHHFELGEASAQVIWPLADQVWESQNDHSIVMAFTAAGRRVLMCGDIQTQAMTAMIDSDMDLKADVTDLPHHGSFPPPAVAWLQRVQPSVVLQSSGPARLRWDHWANHLPDIDRYITARDGATTLTIDHDGNIHATTFRNTTAK